MVLTREEWQENPTSPIDSVMEAECDLRDRNRLIKLMGEIIYKQHKIIKNACDEDGSPRVSYTDFAGMEWQYGFVRDAYVELMDDFMDQLPKDWTDSLEV